MDVYPAGDDQLMAWGFAHRRPIEVEGIAFDLAPATYVVAMKLRWWALSRQDKHLRDIRSMLALAPEQLDQELIRTWAGPAGALAAWEECLRRSGEE